MGDPEMFSFFRPRFSVIYEKTVSLGHTSLVVVGLSPVGEFVKLPGAALFPFLSPTEVWRAPKDCGRARPNSLADCDA
jgi:hypothetical protein